MAVEDGDIRSIYFNTDEFGVTASVTPSAGITSHRPRITCRSADISSLAHGDSVVVNSTNYTVAEILKDGTGITEIFLETA